METGWAKLLRLMGPNNMKCSAIAATMDLPPQAAELTEETQQRNYHNAIGALHKERIVYMAWMSIVQFPNPREHKAEQK